MTMMEKLKVLQIYVAKSLQNCDGLRRPYNLSKINTMLKQIIKEAESGTMPG